MNSEALPGDPRSCALGLASTILPLHSGARAAWHYEVGLFLGAARTAGSLWQRLDLVRAVDETVASFVVPAQDSVDADPGARAIAPGQGFGEPGAEPTASHPAQVKIRGYRLAEYNLDQINPGKNLFPLLASDPDGRYGAAIELLRSQLDSQPRTASGGYWHKLIYPDQMWLDGLYMAEPFLARWAFLRSNPGHGPERGGCAPHGHDSTFEGIAFQFALAEEALRNPDTGLLHHGWDESRRQAWADPVTGRSPHAWGRAVGWFLMALVDCLEWIPAHTEGADRAASILRAILERTATAMLAHRDAASGLWWQVLDMPGEPGNYLETSVSSMLAYALAKAVRLGILSREPYAEAARQAWEGCARRFVRRDADGGWHLEGTCAVAGLGGKPYRDGSFAYYIGEPKKTDDCKGVGPFILASVEQWLASQEVKP